MSKLRCSNLVENLKNEEEDVQQETEEVMKIFQYFKDKVVTDAKVFE